MLPKLGNAVIRPARGSSLKPLIQIGSNYIKSIAPLTPSLTVRALSTQIPQQVQAVENKQKQHKPASLKDSTTPQALLDTLEECKTTGNLKGAIKNVQYARELGLATPALYLRLVDIMRESPFDVQECATVAHWFYSPDSNLPTEVLNDIEVWKSVLKLGFRFGSTYRAEDLRALVDRFTEIFDLTTLQDQTAWELLMRAYGIMNRTDAISACITKNGSKENEASFYSSALISYAATNSHEDVEKILEKLKQDNLLTKHMLLKLIRCYGFNGDIAHVSKYMNMCNTMFPGNKCDKTMLLIAHKVTLENICKELERTRGVRGLSLKPDYSRELDQLHESWSALTKDMFTGSNQPVDITDCNVVLEYLTFANRIDPVQFPMELAENIFESYMPANYIKPNDASHRIMLVGYATSQQYNHHYRNIRLDKALEVVSKMQVAGINTLNHPTFHSLFRACLPHRDGNYYFDNFRLNSLLPSRPYTHNRFNVDHRVFEIESIMLEAKLPHDRFTFTTLMTCLAAGGQYRALRSRWRALKVHGLRRDLGMYRLSFALASLDPTQAKRAIVVVRNEMKREIGRVDWETYTAMLDCCVTAQLPTEAKDIMAEMSKAARIANKKKTHADDLAKWPFTDEPDFYLPMLRAAINLPTLNPDQILKEMHDKGIPYNQGIYEAVLSKLALENDEQGIRRLFNQYTMSRFEKEGKIPVPVREAAKPVVPFPTAPYNALDMQFIDVYICSLLDSQDISLVFDVLRTLVDQTDKIGISRQSLEGIVRLAKQEKDKEDLIWFKDQVLPKVTHQNKSLRLLKKKIDMII